MGPVVIFMVPSLANSSVPFSAESVGSHLPMIRSFGFDAHALRQRATPKTDSKRRDRMGASVGLRGAGAAPPSPGGGAGRSESGLTGLPLLPVLDEQAEMPGRRRVGLDDVHVQRHAQPRPARQAEVAVHDLRAAGR